LDTIGYDIGSDKTKKLDFFGHTIRRGGLEKENTVFKEQLKGREDEDDHRQLGNTQY
jgi:hypothetical protein